MRRRVPRELVVELVMLAGRTDTLSAVYEACLIGIDFGKRYEREKKRKITK